MANAGLLLSGALFLLAPDESLISAFLKTIVMICSMTVMVYGAGLLSSMESIPFWRGPLLPVVFLSHSAASGMGFVVAVLVLTGQKEALNFQVTPVAIALLLFTSLFTWLYTRRRASSSEAVRESVRVLRKGRLKGLLVGGVYLRVCWAYAAYYRLFHRFGDLEGSYYNHTICCSNCSQTRWDISFRYSVLEAGIFESVI
jgi:formate-dependent nitrite reductase membrane component NrfD